MGEGAQVVSATHNFKFPVPDARLLVAKVAKALEVIRVQIQNLVGQ